MPTPEYDGVVTSDVVESEEDKKLFTEFFLQAVKNEFKSAQEGRPIFDEIAMVRITAPGSKDVLISKATENYKHRFPNQWERFERKMSHAVSGTPLEQVPFLTVGQVAELKAFNCLSLEQLANMSDMNASKFMGMHDLRKKAQNLLAAAKDSAPLTQMQATIDAQKNEIEALKNQVAQLMSIQKDRS